MFIDGIKAVPSDSTEVKIWRFKSDQGSHRNLCVLAVPAAEQQILRVALRFALFGSRDAKIKAALVQITDNSGESWAFERQGDQFRCFRGRQFFDARPEVCLKELFKDYLPTGSSSESIPVHSCLAEYDLSFDGQALEARPSAGQQLRSSPWERAGAQRKEANQQALMQKLGLKYALSRTQLKELLVFGDGLSRRVLALQLQGREVDKTFDQLSKIDTQLAARLEKEVVLINRLSALAEPLFDPAKNPRTLLERLREVETELEDLREKCKIEDLPPPEPAVEWSQVLQVLTRYLASDKLEKAARKTLSDAKTQLKPVYEEYRASISRFLQYDRHLIQELETCLRELDEHVRTGALEQEKQRDNIAGKLNKLLGFDADKGKSDGGLGPHTLELSRAAVNQCLHSLGRLYSELEQNQGTHDEKLLDLEQRYEKIQVESVKAKEQWLNISRQLNLAPECGVRELVTLMNQHGRLALLHARRLCMQEEIREQRQELQALAQLIEEWRTHTGSQKSDKLDQSLAVLAEARSVLQYAEKKRSQLLKLQAVTNKFEAYRQIKAKIGQDIDLLQHRWRQALEAWGLPQQNLEPELWEKIAESGREVLLLEEIFQESSKPLRNELVFAAEALEAPLTFYHWKEAPQGNKARLQVLQQVELADDAGFALIFSDDKVLVDMLLKLGLSRCHTVEPKPEAPVAKAQRPLMSEKARAALEIFANKQTGGSRNTV